MDVKELDILGDGIDRHWYYRAKAAALLRCLDGRDPQEILDIGAGSGFFSQALLRRTAASRAVCVDTAYDGDRDELRDGKAIAYRRAVDGVTADTVLLMDVLEHVDDELELLSPYVRAAKPGTRFVISVPAFRFLWSGHDVFLEHRRRYTRRSVLKRLAPAGLEPVAVHYFFAAVFPVAAATRIGGRLMRGPSRPARSQLRRTAPWLNAMLYRMCALELPLMKCNHLFGLSVFGVFRKP